MPLLLQFSLFLVRYLEDVSVDILVMLAEGKFSSI